MNIIFALSISPTIEMMAHQHPSVDPSVAREASVVSEEGSVDATGENGKALPISGAEIHANINSMIEQASAAATLGHHNGSLYHETLTQVVSAAGVVQLAMLPFGSVIPVQQKPKKWVRWTDQEDGVLRMAVHLYGANSFELISKFVFCGSRTEDQCKNRWEKALQPGLFTGQWTKEEDDIIVQSVAVGNKKWSNIAKRLPGRIGEQVKKRWVNNLDPDVKKGVWSEAEMRILRTGQAELGNKWAEIAERIPGRPESPCKNRWYNQMTSDKRAAKKREGGSLEELEQQEHQPTATATTEQDPAKKKRECVWWSEAEMRILQAGQMELGNKWAEIAKRIPGRSEISCKSRWNSGLASARRAKKKGGCVEEQKTEEQNIKQYKSDAEQGIHLDHDQQTNGGKASEFGGHLMQRSSLEEREDTEVEDIVQSVAASNKKWWRWSEAEMRILRAGQMELGNKWAEIAKRIPGRTEISCKNRWYEIQDRGPSTKRTCSHEGCGKWVRKGQFCAQHGPNRYCIVEGCTKVSQKRRHCTRCWNKKNTSKGNKSVVVNNEDQAALALCNLANGGNTHTRLDKPGRKRTYQEFARLS